MINSVLTCRAAGNESHIITPQEAKSLCPLLKVDDLEVKPHNFYFFLQNITSYCYCLSQKILSNVCMAKNLIIYHIFQLLKVNLMRIIFVSLISKYHC